MFVQRCRMSWNDMMCNWALKIITIILVNSDEWLITDCWSLIRMWWCNWRENLRGENFWKWRRRERRKKRNDEDVLEERESGFCEKVFETWIKTYLQMFGYHPNFLSLALFLFSLTFLSSFSLSLFLFLLKTSQPGSVSLPFLSLKGRESGRWASS